MFPDRIETDRLMLEALTRENVCLFEFYRICSSDSDIDAVTRYLSWDPHETVAETREFLESVEEKREAGEGTDYVIRPKPGEVGAGEIAGTTGLSVDWDRKTATLGIWLRKPFWGRGYSGERAAALMDLAFDRLDLELVAVKHMDGNEKSRRAIRKYVETFGGQYDGIIRNDLPLDGGVTDAHRYTVSREQYRDAIGKR